MGIASCLGNCGQRDHRDGGDGRFEADCEVVVTSADFRVGLPWLIWTVYTAKQGNILLTTIPMSVTM
jgi:hypothetical protein